MNWEQFLEFSRRRLELSLKKYTTPNGDNAAYHRDNMLDLYEEVSDLKNILELFLKRVERMKYALSPDASVEVKVLFTLIENIVESLDFIDKSLPPEFRKEEVKRLVWRVRVLKTKHTTS